LCSLDETRLCVGPLQNGFCYRHAVFMLPLHTVSLAVVSRWVARATRQ